MRIEDLDAGLYLYRARVVRVVDGDTLIAELDLGCHVRMIREVRLVGINTPELSSRDAGERARAVEARERVEALVLDRRCWVRTELDRGDKYGRLLGRVYAEDGPGEAGEVNAFLVARGLAVPYDGGRRT